MDNEHSTENSADLISEAEFLKKGDEYYYGLHGKNPDYDAYARLMQLGHDRGYLNCTAELSVCYSMGHGVPRDYARALELAREMEQKNFPLAWAVYALAYASGQGVPLDHEKAKFYGGKLLNALSKPVPGVDECIRYEQVLSVCLALSSYGCADMVDACMKLARECMLESELPERYAVYAGALLLRFTRNENADDEARAAAEEEILPYLEKGVSRGDCLSMYLMACMQASRGAPADVISELLYGALPSGMTEVYGDIIRCCKLNEQLAKDLRDAFWATCNMGISCHPREDALPCHIILFSPPIDCVWTVHAQPANDICSPESRIVLCNFGTESLSNLSLRLCSGDAGVDFSCELEGSIAPGGAMELDTAEYERKAGKAFGSELHVELRSGERYADMTLAHSQGLPFFYHKWEGAELPLQLWWETGMWGSRVLCVRCTEGELHNLRVFRTATGATAYVRLLREGEVARYGRWQFRSFKGLAAGEELALLADESPAVMVRMDA